MSPFRRLSWIFLEHCWYQYWVRAVEVIAIVEVTSIRNSDETKKTPTTNGASNTRETRVKCRRTRQARECGTRAIDGFKVGLGIDRERSLPSRNITQSRSMTSMSQLLYFSHQAGISGYQKTLQEASTTQILDMLNDLIIRLVGLVLIKGRNIVQNFIQCSIAVSHEERAKGSSWLRHPHHGHF